MVILTEFQAPESPILYEQRNTKAVLDSKDLGVGSLYISERTLCWKEEGGIGFCLDYPHISMHAVTSDPTVYPTECIFIAIDGHITIPGVSNGVIETDDEDASEPTTSELLLIPEDGAAIHPIFNTISQCQALNPDPEDAVDDEDDDEFYDDVEYDNAYDGNRSNDYGAGGDTEMNHLSAQLRNHSLHRNHFYGSGDQNFDDEHFDDAD